METQKNIWIIAHTSETKSLHMNQKDRECQHVET
jgi:hypothetical protein